MTTPARDLRLGCGAMYKLTVGVVVVLVVFTTATSLWMGQLRPDGCHAKPAEDSCAPFTRRLQEQNSRLLQEIMRLNSSVVQAPDQRQMSGELQALKTQLEHLEATNSEILEQAAQSKRAYREQLLRSMREVDACIDADWPGRPEPHYRIRGPKRKLSVMMWHPPAPSDLVNIVKDTKLIPTPKGLERYFRRPRLYDGSLPLPEGLIPISQIGAPKYKEICDGAAVQHANYSAFSESDIIFFQNPLWGPSGASESESDGMPPRLAHHLWVLRFAGECVSYYPAMGSPAFLSRFNFTIGYHRGFYHMQAAPYVSFNLTKILGDPFSNPFEGKNGSASVVMMVTNCLTRNDRTTYLEELMKHIKVHSYGHCLSNKAIPEHILLKHGAYNAIGDWHGVKMDVIRPYKFLIAFENSNCYDYVTEKVYDGLIGGLIPIYLGAANIDDYVPDHSIIRARDFSSPQSLAHYLSLVDRTPALYESYFEWRKHGVPDRIARLLRTKKRNVCDYIAKLEWSE